MNDKTTMTAPSSDGQTATPSAAPEAKGPEPKAPETPGSSTPAEPSPSGDDAKPGEGEAPKDENAKDEAAKDDAPDPRAVVPERADGYRVNLDDEAKGRLGLGDDDPLVKGLFEAAAEGKRPQGWVDDVLEGAAELAKRGLFDAGFDPKAEAEALGENADGRRRDAEVWAKGLMDRGVIDEGEFGELMSLTPTASGVKLIEKLKGLAGPAGDIQAPSAAGDSAGDLKAKAQAMAGDPRYHTDRDFKREADEMWKKAYPGAR